MVEERILAFMLSTTGYVALRLSGCWGNSGCYAGQVVEQVFKQRRTAGNYDGSEHRNLFERGHFCGEHLSPLISVGQKRSSEPRHAGPELSRV